MAFPCWHECPHCRKDWSHSIPNPCPELDPYFLPCQSCVLTAEPLPERRRAIPSEYVEDVEDVTENYLTASGEVPTLIPADVSEMGPQ